MPEVRPYGSWPSPLGPEALVAGAARVGEARVDGDDVWWAEARPSQGGRIALVRRRVDGTVHEVLPEGWSARTGLLEYGGGAWCVEFGVVTFSSWADQRLHRLVADDPEAVPVPLTPEPRTPRGLRYGDVVPWDRSWVLAVREAHPGEDGVPAEATEPVHQVVAVPVDGTGATDPDRVRVLVGGPDFVSDPRPGPGRLAWVQWDHPRMPWDGTELCVAGLGRDAGGGPVLRGDPQVVAGGPEESVVQPEWDGAGDLLFCSDRTGWWNLHRWDGTAVEAVAPMDAEVGGPRWVAGLRWYAPLADGRVLASATAGGTTGLVVVEGGRATPLAVEVGGAPLTMADSVVAGPGTAQAVVVAASGRAGATPLLLDLPPAADAPGSDAGRGRRAVPGAPASGTRALRATRDVGLGPGDVALPEPFSFPSAGGRTAHALLYRPTSSTSIGPEGERPPLVVMIHGGPTSAARPMFDLSRQVWTSRGFAVADVDHGGSTGYGRPFRRLLDGAWGVVDVEDCVAAARHLAAAGEVDGDRMVIRGGSAGGFTVLLALATGGAFAAGTSLYGVTDLAALARDTHKLESRYLDGLVGPWPEAADVYAARSPLAHLDRLRTPVLVLQGADDAVVPPAQAEAVVAALAAAGVHHRYLLFEGEGHGFRRADTIAAAFAAELAFYGEVLGFTPA